MWCRAFDNVLLCIVVVQPQNDFNWLTQKSHSLNNLCVASPHQWSVSLFFFSHLLKPKHSCPACFERWFVLVASREEAGLHFWQQELPQRVFGSGPGGYCWTSPGCCSQRRPLGHLTGKVLSHSIIALHEQKMLNNQAKMLSTKHCFYYNTPPPHNSPWFALNLPFLLAFSTLRCVTWNIQQQKSWIKTPIIYLLAKALSCPSWWSVVITYTPFFVYQSLSLLPAQHPSSLNQEWGTILMSCH